LEFVLNESKADIALMGVQPTYPSEKYGYIITKEGSNQGSYRFVNSFKEKPTENEARELIKKNALWNCGVFSFKLGYMVQLLKNRGIPLEYDELIKVYDTLSKRSFDYEVLERSKNIVVVPYNKYWKDLGTWNTLTEEMGTNLIGNGFISEDSINTHVINELDAPVTVIGLSNVIVAVSPDGILVSDKNKSPQIKEIAKLFEQRAMYKEKHWGSYRILDYNSFDDNYILTRRINIHKNKSLSYHKHCKRKEIWTIIKGEGVVIIDNDSFKISIGDTVKINPNVKHAIKACSDIELIEIQSGPLDEREDIVRFSINWDEFQPKVSMP